MDIVSNFNVSYNTDSMHFAEALSTYNFLKEGYTFPIEDLEFKYEDFFKFIDILKGTYKDIKHYDFTNSSKNIFKQYVCNDFIIYAQGNSKELYCNINSKDIETQNNVFNVFKKFYKEDTEVRIFVTTYFSNSGRLDSTVKTLSNEELDSISDSYYPYLNNDIMYKQFFTLPENILIIAGSPGLGKTKMSSSMLKYAAENEQYMPYDKIEINDQLEAQFLSVAYIKNTSVLSDDSFWRELGAREFDFVILDDLDYFLTSRNAEVTSNSEDEKNKFLNQFLSFTDGIEKHKTKFIITTNQPVIEIDTALLRRGRLFDILELRDLSLNEALVIWEENKLSEKDFYQTFDKADRVLPADLGSEISKRNNSRITESLEKYLLEDGISKIQKSQKTKKAGF